MSKCLILFCVLVTFALAGCSGRDSYDTFIKNSRGEKIYVEVSGLNNKAGRKLVFLQHGMGTSHKDYLIQAAKRIFLENGFTVVAFDNRNALGESDGKLEDASISTYIEDLNTVIDWSRKQDFYSEPFSLLGVSMGGASVIEFSRLHPAEVCELVLISPVVGGKYWEKAALAYTPEDYENWRSKGWYLFSNGKEISRVPYALVEDAKKYDAVKTADRIRADVLVVVGDKDVISAPEHNRLFFNRLNTAKKMVVLPDSDHIYLNLYQSGRVYDAFKTVIEPEIKAGCRR